MPQDTTIYLDGNKPLPALLDSSVDQLIQPRILVERAETDYATTAPVYFLAATFIIVYILGAISRHNQQKRNSRIEKFSGAIPIHSPLQSHPAPLVYTGRRLKFSDELLSAVLVKRFAYYKTLDRAGQLKFIRRLKKFLAAKTFVIHDENGFKEMPILVSATAIQISFGLDKFMLPNFTTFNIYPSEFIGTYPFLRILIGNVTGNTINLSWKHLLEGLQHRDGQNVGIHEIAHALYYQTFVIEKNVDRDFRDTFTGFNHHGNKVYEAEKSKELLLYTEYAMKDFQEFWAESVEIFFEKPASLKTFYPELYIAMRNLLNQDPAEGGLNNIT